jgi:PHD/YefM family antitoxin component YafN of YafNO toxin-antitoxin module
MASEVAKTVTRVSATKFRERFKEFAGQAKGDKVILVVNRRQESKYLVDKEWLDVLMSERESVLATLEILADRQLTTRLRKLAKRIDADVQARKLHTMEEVFGRE